MSDRANERIESALVALVRRADDPRGNQQINTLAGATIERAASVMLRRIGELEPVRLSQLAEASGIEMSTASRQVARLFENGYIERMPDPRDGRATMHQLSPSGRDLLERLVQARHRWFSDRLAGFTLEDRSRFADYLDRFIEASNAPLLPSTTSDHDTNERS